MAAVVHLHDRFDPTKRDLWTVARPMTVRRLVSKHPRLRAFTSVRRPGGPYGRRKVREFNRPTVCFVNGRAVPRAQWKRTSLGPSDVVTFWTPPAGGMGGGGGGGGGGSNPIGVVLAIAIAIAVPYLGPMLGAAIGLTGALAGAIGGAIVSVALGAVAYGIMSLFAQPAAPAAQGSYNSGYGGGATAPSPTYSLSAQGNTARLGQAIPELFGRHQVFPDFVTEPYVRYVDNEQYIHMLLGVSMGSVELEEVRIGDTPISSFEEIVYEQLEPGDTPDSEIADPRWLTCKDIAQVELPDSAEGSAYKGPFAANPGHTLVGTIEVDHIAPNGFYKYNTGTGGLDTKSATVEVEGRLIDEAGDPLGDWTALDTLTLTNGASREPVRWTSAITLPETGRWEIRERRTDTKDTDIQAGHRVDWIGLRGYLTTARTFAGLTVLGVRMKATGDLNGQTSRRLNCIATRKLPTWDDEEEEMGTELVATRCPCDAFAYICRSSNGGRFADSRIDLEGLYASRADFAELDWTFDFVFDQAVTVSEALARVARAVVAERVLQGGKVRLVRDVASTAPVAMFGPRNIRARSLETEYAMVTEETADGVTGQYMSPTSWKPFDVTVAFDDSPQNNLSTVQMPGITNREQLRAVLWNLVRGNRYRRKVYRWRSEMEGLAVLFGDPVSLSYDVPSWGQTAEVVDWDAESRIFTLSEPLEFTLGETHYVAVRDNVGHLCGPYEVEAVEDEPLQVQLADEELPEDFPDIVTGGDRERTFVQFGSGEEYSKRLKVIAVTPQSETEVEIVAVDDDARMYADLPEPEEDDPADPGAPQDPIEISVDADTTNLNLRTLANANGYAGLSTQPVTITIEAGVEVWSTSASVAAIVRGTWPSGFRPKLVVRGTLSGAGGDGGAGNAGAGVAGGTALDARSGPLELDYDTGLLRGGGGGGGGGGLGVGDWELRGFASNNGGGGGGAGQGHVGATGGAAGTPLGDSLGYTGNAGGNSSPSAAGSRGTHYWEATYPGIYGGNGGDGGGWGTAGTAGTAGYAGGGGAQSGGPAGAAGKSIHGIGNVTVTGTPGTLTGPTA